MGIARRKRVHHAGLVIDSLILSALQCSTDTEGRWLDAQRSYEMLGGKRSGASWRAVRCAVYWHDAVLPFV